MPKVTILLFGCALVVLIALASDVDARRIDDDLEVAASEKHEKHEKGEKKEHHEEHHEKKGGKEKKGYESEHGYVKMASIGCVFECEFV